MAKKENTAEVQKTTAEMQESIAEVQESIAEVQQDPWQVKKTIRLSKPSTQEAKSFYAAVNGRSFNVPYNKDVEVPMPIYEAIRNAQALQAEAEEKADAMKMRPGDEKYL